MLKHQIALLKNIFIAVYADFIKAHNHSNGVQFPSLNFLHFSELLTTVLFENLVRIKIVAHA